MFPFVYNDSCFLVSLYALAVRRGRPKKCKFKQVKTHLQSRANEQSIAVGHQHKYTSLTQAFRHIYQSQGILGLWRGSSTAMMRVTVASGIQMLTFEKSLGMDVSLSFSIVQLRKLLLIHLLINNIPQFADFVRAQNLFSSGHSMTVFCASLVSGVFVAFGMSPFDLVATRYYNQGLDSTGKGSDLKENLSITLR